MRHDIVHLTPIDALGTVHGVAHGMTARIEVADHTARHTQLLRPHDFVVIGDNTGTRRHIYAVSRLTDFIKNQRIEHMDTLGNDDGILIALHCPVSAGIAGLEIIPGHLCFLTLRQPADAGDQELHVDAVGRFPVGSLRGPLIQRQEEVIHAQQADLHAQIFQILAQAHGGRGFTGTGGAGQCHKGLLFFTVQNRGSSGADLIMKDLLTAQHKLRFITHCIVDIFQIDNAHEQFPPYRK